MGKASKRRLAAQRAAPPPPPAGPSGQLLAGLGIALVVVVIVVLVAGGGLGQVGTPAGTSTSGSATLDTAQVKRLENAVKANPADTTSMIDLGNLYFDADLYEQAIPWYAKALEILPNSTVSFTAWIYSCGFAWREIWNNIGSGTAVADLTNNPAYPQSPTPPHIRPISAADTAATSSIDPTWRLRSPPIA